MAVWVYWSAPWTLPVVGLLVGALTNLVALKIIFEPVQPVNCGCWTLQGLFLKRQPEVSAEYGRTITEQVIHPTLNRNDFLSYLNQHTVVL